MLTNNLPGPAICNERKTELADVVSDAVKMTRTDPENKYATLKSQST